MIASLTGIVQSVRPNTCVLNVHGVGYLVNITTADQRELHLGDEHTFYTSLVVREDSLTLFGFDAPESVEIFDVLLSVSGVGPRSALAILSELSPAAILGAVVDENDAVFKKVTGIGPKTAKLIIVQLAGKISALSAGAHTTTSASASTGVSATVLNALVGLGWNERIAQEALDSLGSSSGTTQDSAQLLKQALAVLAGKK